MQVEALIWRTCFCAFSDIPKFLESFIETFQVTSLFTFLAMQWIWYSVATWVRNKIADFGYANMEIKLGTHSNTVNISLHFIRPLIDWLTYL